MYNDSIILLGVLTKSFIERILIKLNKIQIKSKIKFTNIPESFAPLIFSSNILSLLNFSFMSLFLNNLGSKLSVLKSFLPACLKNKDKTIIPNKVIILKPDL